MTDSFEKHYKKNVKRFPLTLKYLPDAEIGSVHKDGSGTGWIAWSPEPVSADDTARLYPCDEGFKCPYGEVGIMIDEAGDEDIIGRKITNIEVEQKDGKWEWVVSSIAIWSPEKFLSYVRESVDDYYWVSPATIVLRSFYVAEIYRPEQITVRMFDYLYALAKKEIQTYKIIK